VAVIDVSEPFELAAAPLTGLLRHVDTADGACLEFVLAEPLLWQGRTYLKFVARLDRPGAWYGSPQTSVSTDEVVAKWRGGLALRADLR